MRSISPDVVVTWLGAAGVIAYLVHVHGRRTRSFLEGRMLALLYCLAALFTVRGFFWIYGGEVLRMLTFVPAVLLPLAATLFVEALLRRHAPPPLKWLVALATPALLAWVPLADRADRIGDRELFFRALNGFMVLVFLALACWLALRRRAALSPAENAFVDGTALAAAVGVLAALTDFRLRPEWLDLRLGGLGGLFFVYAFLRLGRLSADARPARRRFGAVAWIALKALALAAAFGVVAGGSEGPDWGALAAVALGFVLLFAILDLLHTLDRADGEDAFRRWLVDVPVSSREALVASLDRLPLAERHAVLEGGDLAGYDGERLAGLFAATPVWTLSALRAARDEERGDLEALEQLVDLLEGLGMRQAALLGERPVSLLLVNVPDVATADEWATDLALVSKLARTLPAGERSG
jgi:hypothetical protein